MKNNPSAVSASTSVAILKIAKFARWTPAFFALCIAAGCATLPDGAQRDPRDPFEPFNRSIARFNDKVDAAVFKPIATAYRNLVPSLARSGVSNFFSNLGEVWSTVNNTLQLKPQAAAESWMRFNVNTFLGLGGLLDIASEFDIDRHEQDFGRTLAHYGVPTGPYLVLPLLGPSTVRDALVIPVESKGNLLLYVDDISTRNSLLGLRLVDARANLLRVGSVLDVAALDKYSFTRDVFMEIRRNGTVDEADSSDYVPLQPVPAVEPGQVTPPLSTADAPPVIGIGMPVEDLARPDALAASTAESRTGGPDVISTSVAAAVVANSADLAEPNLAATRP